MQGFSLINQKFSRAIIETDDFGRLTVLSRGREAAMHWRWGIDLNLQWFCRSTLERAQEAYLKHIPDAEIMKRRAEGWFGTADILTPDEKMGISRTVQGVSF